MSPKEPLPIFLMMRYFLAMRSSSNFISKPVVTFIMDSNMGKYLAFSRLWTRNQLFLRLKAISAANYTANVYRSTAAILFKEKFTFGILEAFSLQFN